MKGELHKAIKDFSLAINMEPGNISAYYQRGNAYDSLGRQSKAIADYQKVVSYGEPELSQKAKEAMEEIRKRGIVK